MQSSERLTAARLGAFVLVSALTTRVVAEPRPEGFAVDRLSAPAPGSLWLVTDSLEMRGPLGGGVGMSLGYVHDALRVPRPVVGDRFVAGFGAAVTHGWIRGSLVFEAPFVMKGESGLDQGYAWTAPRLDPSSHPDTLSDVQVAVDARVLGAPDARFRLGVGGRLFVPSGERGDYVTDGTYRAEVRALVAGELTRGLPYAACLGVHGRPRDDRGIPEAPRGSELVAGASVGPRVGLGSDLSMGGGPEVRGATAIGALLGDRTTAVEGLLTGRLERRDGEGSILRLKLGVGAGLHAHFGAPARRVMLSIEVMGHAPETDRGSGTARGAP